MARVKPVQVRSERDFRALLESATQDLQLAVFHWRLYRKLRRDTKRYVRELNEARAFWSLTMSAHADAALFRLVRLYEPDGGLSLGRLVETIRSHPDLFDTDRFRERLKDNPFVESLAKGDRHPTVRQLNRDARSVGEAERLVAKLLTLRKRLLAHRDPRVVLGSVPDPLSGLSARQVSALLSRGSRIVNRYWQLFAATSHLMRIMGEDDYRTVLERVRECATVRRGRFREELRQVMGRRSRRTRS